MANSVVLLMDDDACNKRAIRRGPGRRGAQKGGMSVLFITVRSRCDDLTC